MNDKSCQYIRGNDNCGNILKGTQRSLTYSVCLGFEHLHEGPSGSGLVGFISGHFPGVQKLQMRQLVQNKIPAKEQQPRQIRLLETNSKSEETC